MSRIYELRDLSHRFHLDGFLLLSLAGALLLVWA